MIEVAVEPKPVRIGVNWGSTGLLTHDGRTRFSLSRKARGNHGSHGGERAGQLHWRKNGLHPDQIVLSAKVSGVRI
jgi:hypothetical protein